MKKKGTKNLTYTQRLKIETLLNAKVSKQEIADIVGINIRTLYYEIKRGAYVHRREHRTLSYGTRVYNTVKYSAQIAQDKYELACTAKGRPLKVGNDYDFVHYVENRIKKGKLSPGAVLGEIKHKNLEFRTNVSKTTLYRYIEFGVLDGIKLTINRKTKYRRTVIKRAPRGMSIEQRPKEIAMRKTFGHWEMDCVCGSTKASLLVLTERLTRKEIIFKIPNQKSNSIVKCLNVLELSHGKNFKSIFKSITVDNGMEFSDYKALENSLLNKEEKRTSIYYCHPYCSSERGSNERLNREIRRLIPKGSDISNYSMQEIKNVENWINTYPREIFNFATSEELYNRQLELLLG